MRGKFNLFSQLSARIIQEKNMLILTCKVVLWVGVV